MLFPCAVVALLVELPVGAFDDPVAVDGSAVGGVPCGYGKKAEIHPRTPTPLDSVFDGAAAIGSVVDGAVEDGPEGGDATAGVTDFPPGLLT